MSSIEINQVLAQMRLMAAQAQNAESAAAGETKFDDLLKNSINAVNDLQQHSSGLRTAFEFGDPDVDLATVMIASQKASVAFQATVEVRNKLVEAYKEVMQMAI